MASSFQSSSSTPVAIQTPENNIINQLSGVAAGLAQQMNSWAQGVFAKTSQITDQAVGNFFNVSQQMMGLSNNLTSQYNDIFAPQNASLAREADSYNSTTRQQVNMGMAGATQAQAGDAALKNSEEQLRSYGIDPSSGRYASLDKAAAVQNAANVAGAENLQRDRDITTGQNLRAQAVQIGATLPAAIANVNNTAIQANTGASNATLANANTGANLQRLANEYLKTAMDVKLPPIGNQSQSSGNSSSPDPFGGSRPGGGGSGGGYAPTGGGYAPAGPAWMPQHGGDTSGSAAAGGGSRPRTPGSAANIMQIPPYGRGDYSDPTGQNYDPMGGIDPNSFSGGGSYLQPEQGYNMGIGQPSNNYGTDNGYPSNPFDNSGFGQTYDYGGQDQSFNGMGGGQNTEWGNISYDPSANNQGGASDWANTYDQPNPDTNWGTGASQYGNVDYSNSANGGYDTTSPDSFYSAGDYSMPSDNYDMGGAYAKGGPIPPRGAQPMQGAGRQLPPSMSPSGGQQVDDIQARGPGGSQLQLNANEFVIPQDVALWKGQEFFQNLIEQSRKKRVTAPAQPSQTPPQQPMR